MVMEKIDIFTQNKLSKNKINIGIILNFEANSWLGGYNYYLNFYNLIKRTNCKLTVFCNKNNANRIYKDFKLAKIVVTDYFSYPKKFLGIKSKLKILILGRDLETDKYLNDNNIDILVLSGFLGKKSIIKNIPIIWDFQEIINPKNFSLKQILLRKFNNYMCANHSNHVLLGTKHDNKIFKKYYKSSKVNNSYINMPETLVNFKILKKEKLQKLFKLNLNNFLILPNQFWKHKNHILVLKALKIIKYRYKKNILIVSTGQKNDWRHTQNFSEIKKFIKKNKLEKNFKILGVVKQNQLLNLIFYSKALINPSKAEGESGSVEIAKAFNKYTLLSNIDVHREQKKNKTFLFNVKDYKKLAKLILRVNNLEVPKNINQINYLKLHNNYINRQRNKYIQLLKLK